MVFRIKYQFPGSRHQIKTCSWWPMSVLLMIGLLSFLSCAEKIEIPDEDISDLSSMQILLKKPNLKVLDIGNSYSDGALALLPTVANNCKVDVKDMCLYKFIRSGASFYSWCQVYDNQDTYNYSFYRAIGDLSVNIPTGSSPGDDGNLFRRVLSDVEWDLIIIHQYSPYAPYYDLWGSDGEGGCLDKLLSIIKKHQPNATIGFLIVHSYWDNYGGNKEKSSFERWQKIANSVQRLMQDYDIQFIIPYGTAVENLRSSSLNNGFDLTRDGTHLGYGLGEYTAACCYYESLLYPRTGVSCYMSPANIDVSGKESKYPAVNVKKSNAFIAQKAAILAIEDMFHCNNPEYN